MMKRARPRKAETIDISDVLFFSYLYFFTPPPFCLCAVAQVQQQSINITTERCIRRGDLSLVHRFSLILFVAKYRLWSELLFDIQLLIFSHAVDIVSVILYMKIVVTLLDPVNFLEREKPLRKQQVKETTRTNDKNDCCPK